MPARRAVRARLSMFGQQVCLSLSGSRSASVQVLLLSEVARSSAASFQAAACSFRVSRIRTVPSLPAASSLSKRECQLLVFFTAQRYDSAVLISCRRVRHAGIVSKRLDTSNANATR